MFLSKKHLKHENKTKEKGLDFLDVYTLTNRGDGFSNAKWHLDSYHLSPEGMLEAWSKYLKKNNFENNRHPNTLLV